MTKVPIRLIQCIVRYDRLDMMTGINEPDCRATVLIPSIVNLPSMKMAAEVALRRQIGEGLVLIHCVRLAKFAGNLQMEKETQT